MDIHLNDFEIALFDSIVFPPDDLALDDQRAADNVELARLLAVSLMERGAVPEQRMRFFDAPEHNPGQPHSVRGGLEQTGGDGDAAYAQAAFLKYLRYFICGPELPEKVERAFRRELVERGGAGHRRFVARVREMAHALGASTDQREKFYQQALEFGLGAEAAREIADAAMPSQA